MMGATVDEAMSYVDGAFSSPVNGTLYRLVLQLVFQEDYGQVVAKYPPAVKRFYCLLEYLQVVSGFS